MKESHGEDSTSEGLTIKELPDVEKEISRIVLREEIAQKAIELKEKYGFSNEEIAEILDDLSEMFDRN